MGTGAHHRANGVAVAAPTRVALALALSGTMAILPSPRAPSLAAAIGCTVATVVIFRPPWRRFVPVVAGAAGLIGFTLAPLAWYHGVGEIIPLAVRSGACTATAVALLSELDPLTLESALLSLRVPPVLAAVVGTLLRQAEALVVDGRRLVLARQLRGARGRAIGPEILARLLLRAHAQAERVQLAATLRGYDPRLISRPTAWLAARDRLAFAGGLSVASALFALAWFD